MLPEELVNLDVVTYRVREACAVQVSNVSYFMAVAFTHLRGICTLFAVSSWRARQGKQPRLHCKRE